MGEGIDIVRAGSRVGTTWGIVVIILGILAMVMPFIAGVAMMTMIGLILIATGIAQFFYTFQSKSFGETIADNND